MPGNRALLTVPPTISGVEIDRAELLGNYDVKGQAAPTSVTDVTGLSIMIPPQNRPFQVEFDALWNLSTGTSAIAAKLGMYAYLADVTGTLTQAAAFATAIQVTAANADWYGQYTIRRRFEPNAATVVYKVMAKLAAAAPASWATGLILGGDSPNSGNNQPAVLRAVSL